MFCLAKIIISNVIICSIRCFLAKIMAVFYILQSNAQTLLCLCLIMLLEAEGEKHEHQEGVAGEDKPNGVPVANLIGFVGHLLHRGIIVYHRLCRQHTERGAEAVGHDHKQALCAAAYLGLCVLVNVQRAGDVEEIECHAVDKH